MNRIIYCFVLALFFSACENKRENQSKINLNSPEFIALLNESNRVGTFFYFATREVDQKLTTNCGIAAPGTAPTTPGAAAAPTPAPAQGTTNTKFNVVSQIIFKPSGETLSFRFTYDTIQTSGALSPQQGFTLTGGVFNNTVTGTQGTVNWSGQGAGYIDDATTTPQTLAFLNVSVDLRGTFLSGATTTTTVPLQCFTTDNINCTSATASTQCFTTDNKLCIASTAATSGAKPVNISGTIKCNSSNVIQ